MSVVRPRRRSRSSPHRGGECGAVTPLVTAACAVIILLGAAASLAVTAAVAASRARVAADLSAVAGAGALVAALPGGTTDACRFAAVVAARNGAELAACSVDRSVNVSVEVSVTPSAAISWPVLPGSARARARAGPEAATGRAASQGAAVRRSEPARPERL